MSPASSCSSQGFQKARGFCRDFILHTFQRVDVAQFVKLQQNPKKLLAQFLEEEGSPPLRLECVVSIVTMPRKSGVLLFYFSNVLPSPTLTLHLLFPRSHANCRLLSSAGLKTSAPTIIVGAYSGENLLAEGVHFSKSEAGSEACRIALTNFYAQVHHGCHLFGGEGYSV
jgi:dsRNA-specific ribonuclease